MSTTDRPGLIQLTAAARGELRVLGRRPGLAPEGRARLEQRAKLLAWAGNGWHLVGFAVALGAGRGVDGSSPSEGCPRPPQHRTR